MRKREYAKKYIYSCIYGGIIVGNPGDDFENCLFGAADISRGEALDLHAGIYVWKLLGLHVDSSPKPSGYSMHACKHIVC